MPTYDKRGVLKKLLAQQLGKPRTTQPPPTDGTRTAGTGAQVDPGFYRDKPSANALVGGNSGPQRGTANISQFKQPGPNFEERIKNAQFNSEGKRIGMYNATHRHGDPIEALLEKLRAAKRAKRKPRGSQSYEPDTSYEPS